MSDRVDALEALERLRERREADGVTRSTGRTYGTDGDVTVEAIHWPDGTATLRAHRWDHDGEHMWWICGCPEPEGES